MKWISEIFSFDCNNNRYFYRQGNEPLSNTAGNTSGLAQNSFGNGNFQRGGFRASAGSRYSDWMAVSSGVGSSTHSQVSSFAPISTLSTKTASTSNTSSHQQILITNGG